VIQKVSGNTPRGAEVRVRRSYFECRFGQLHVHHAMPSGGGFDEGTTLLCLHAVAMSGRVFKRLMADLGRDRPVYAPDLPGAGESDPPAGAPTVGDHAAAIGDFIHTMRFRQVDVLGWREGAAVAAQLAGQLPQQIRRLVLAEWTDMAPRAAIIAHSTLTLRTAGSERDNPTRIRQLAPKARIVELEGPASSWLEAPSALVPTLVDFLGT
jgi:pimeloyl-ACP methyl ester carboxylesterase